MRRSWLAVMLVLLGCGAKPPPEITMTIDNDPGGDVFIYAEKYGRWVSVPGMRVAVHGQCRAACTEVLGYLPPKRICLLPQAAFIFDSPARGNADDDITTAMLLTAYPSWVRDVLTKAGALTMTSTAATVTIPAAAFYAHDYVDCRIWK